MAANVSTWTNGSAEEEVVGMSGTRAYPAHLTGSTGAPFAGDTTTDNGCLLVRGDFDPQDNPHNIVSKQVAMWVSIFNNGVLIPILFLVGVPGNVLSAAVFRRQGLKERINLCVFLLALADLVVITVTFLLTAEQVYRDLIGPAGFFATYCLGLAAFAWVSMFLSVVIASERCFCVVSPMRAQRLLKTSTMGVWITAISLVLLAGMMAIAGPKHTVTCLFNPVTNTTSQIVYVTKYYLDNKKILDILDVFLYATAIQSLFFIISVVTTAITASKLRSAVKWRQQVTSSTSTATQNTPAGDSKEIREIALTKMLIATSVLFVICMTPTLLVQLTKFVVPELRHGGLYHNLTIVVWSIIPVFRCVNSSLNFFIYYRMGSRFRKTLWTLLPCKRVQVSTYSTSLSSCEIKDSNQGPAEAKKPRVCVASQ